MSFKAGDVIKVRSLEWIQKNCKIRIDGSYTLKREESASFFRSSELESCGNIYEILSWNELYVKLDDKRLTRIPIWAIEDIAKFNVIEILRGNYEIQKGRGNYDEI